MAADGGIRFGNYVLLRRIARGGMAEVFLAQQRGLEGFDRRGAVKRILPHLADSPDFVKMFLSEAKLAAQLSHPNVVHIYDFGKVENDYFIAMEYVEGVHAGQLFKHGERDRMSPTLVARIGADAATALHYAHELRASNGKALGLVHRDVSPANLMVSYDGVVKLCDFGIAKAAAMTDQLTNPGQVKGKYAYMSPEQTIAAPLDGRSDVFSLAVCLWELLAGKTIVGRGDAVEAMRAIRDGKLPPIDKAVPDLPAALANAIKWAMETRREQRATAADLSQALEAFIKASPDIATPMALGAWVRARFPREVTGSHRAISESAQPSSPDTSAGHGTLAAPGTGDVPSQLEDLEDGTSVSNGTIGEPGTSLTQGHTSVPLGTNDLLLATPSNSEDGATLMRPARDLPLSEETPAPTLRDTAPRRSQPAAEWQRGTTDDLEDRETLDDSRASKEQTIAREPVNFETTVRDEKPRVQSSRSVEVRPSALRLPDAPTRVADQMATRIGDPLVTRIGDGGATQLEHVQPHPEPDYDAPRSLPGAPTLFQPVQVPFSDGRDSRQAMFAPTDMVPDVGTRPLSSRAKLMVVLGAIALLSFIVALGAATSKPRPGAKPPLDAEVVALAPPDAAELDAPAATPEATDARREPTFVTSPDGGQPSFVTVNTQPPGGTVRIGNEGARRAPAQFALVPGTYEAFAELDGYQPERRPITVVANVDASFEIAFTRKVHRDPGTAQPPAGTQSGRLTVRTTPYSAVYLGTRKLGETPFAELEIPVGTHTLLFKHPEHATVRRTVVIEAGKTTKLPPFDLP